jgi:cytochrome c-type biogenesis protein CcmH
MILLSFFAVFSHARDAGIEHAATAAGIGLVLVVVVAGYWISGEPRGLAPEAFVAETPAADEMPDISQMIAQLEARLEQQPADAEGWAMLGRSYMVLGQYENARGAYEQLIALDDTLDNLVSYAEASALASPEALEGEAGVLFEQALEIDPEHSKALWYGGVAAWRRGEIELGEARWRRLLAQGPPEELAAIIRQRLAEAAPQAVMGAENEPDAGPAITVQVSLSPELAGQSSAEDTLFIYARRPEGGPPVAIQRLSGANLPLTVQLGTADDLMGQGAPLAPPLEIVARLSATGNAIPQPGDRGGHVLLEVLPESQVEITIDQVVP